MVYDYVITLKKQDYRFVDQVSQLLYVFALAVFSYFYYTHPKTGLPYAFFAAFVLATWVYSFIKKRKFGFTYYRLGLIIAGAGWLLGVERNIWMGVLYIVAGLLERQVKFPQEIGFSKTEVAFNSFPKKKLGWEELNNVVIKDGIITVDQKNNKLIQKEIDEDVQPEVEQEFNSFCRTRLAEASGAYNGAIG